MKRAQEALRKAKEMRENEIRLKEEERKMRKEVSPIPLTIHR